MEKLICDYDCIEVTSIYVNADRGVGGGVDAYLNLRHICKLAFEIKSFSNQILKQENCRKYLMYLFSIIYCFYSFEIVYILQRLYVALSAKRPVILGENATVKEVGDNMMVNCMFYTGKILSIKIKFTIDILRVFMYLLYIRI